MQPEQWFTLMVIKNWNKAARAISWLKIALAACPIIYLAFQQSEVNSLLIAIGAAGNCKYTFRLILLIKFCGV